ncbi:uncharacterized protein K452DRAFT_109782 [Aplosporella prunicola CBS 121167]|uniref:Uncharacterized protein n=1 Tax=Aplosporella prunicola CBS 121167 TaxID=1176127 RepID=A0A6A6BU96_9PEZI|nr:uncharacterized protein K452DRAFT_109782 [Aplosporella prunicola CBS 121167]KAF2146377.1 hypothetical protein K452DRAFT_109782 [Aplosporella prunicola CBS 121167]
MALCNIWETRHCRPAASGRPDGEDSLFTHTQLSSLVLSACSRWTDSSACPRSVPPAHPYAILARTRSLCVSARSGDAPPWSLASSYALFGSALERCSGSSRVGKAGGPGASGLVAPLSKSPRTTWTNDDDLIIAMVHDIGKRIIRLLSSFPSPTCYFPLFLFFFSLFLLFAFFAFYLCFRGYTFPVQCLLVGRF